MEKKLLDMNMLRAGRYTGGTYFEPGPFDYAVEKKDPLSILEKRLEKIAEDKLKKEAMKEEGIVPLSGEFVQIGPNGVMGTMLTRGAWYRVEEVSKCPPGSTAGKWDMKAKFYPVGSTVRAGEYYFNTVDISARGRAVERGNIRAGVKIKYFLDGVLSPVLTILDFQFTYGDLVEFKYREDASGTQGRMILDSASLMVVDGAELAIDSVDYSTLRFYTAREMELKYGARWRAQGITWVTSMDYLLGRPCIEVFEGDTGKLKSLWTDNQRVTALTATKGRFHFEKWMVTLEPLPVDPWYLASDPKKLDAVIAYAFGEGKKSSEETETGVIFAEVITPTITVRNNGKYRSKSVEYDISAETAAITLRKRGW